MKQTIFPILGLLWLHGVAAAEDDIPLLRPEEQQAVEAQTAEFNRAIQPALTEAAKSTVRVWSGKRRLAYGTVIVENRILTKWSEVARAGGNLRVEGAGGVVLAATVSGVYEDDDLAVLETTGSPLTPVRWTMTSPALGSFLAAPQPDGRPAAFGVVSVLERNLRDTDSAFLGVIGSMDFTGPGVRIEEIAPDSGAAAAGLKTGQIIVKVGERPISGLLELKNSLVGVSPGSKIKLLVRSGKTEEEVEVLLGNRPDLPHFPGDRLRQMERMGGPISRVRDSFSRVIQTDMRPRPDQIGGPVVDLKGRVIGITMARTDRTRSFVMPAAAVQKLLENAPQDAALAQVRKPDEQAALPVRRMAAPQGGLQPGGEDRLRRHLTEMQRLMDFMREEMENLEQGR
ncbi:MAG: PDZ domain-containing protein [Verrucomicrobiaceae bacterium]|nr:MAG: PDZ domain-containing protein [Verrucomicrobiaceae bacterium]